MNLKKAPTSPKIHEKRLIPEEPPPNSNGPGTNEEHRKTTKERGKLYQDQIYGPKVLTPLAAEIMDTPEFQRLGGIKQLGFANATYRGAEHTRLAHSVGTYFITRTIMRRIVQNHERFDFSHPGKHLSDSFRVLADNAYDYKKDPRDKIPISYQSKWRGLTEVVSIAALLHDITHVPFGHTLEDEFNNIYFRHDRLGGARLHQLLFDDKSDLKKVFDKPENWIQDISNDDLRKLIYVILSWKEEVDRKELTGFGFDEKLPNEIDNLKNHEDKKTRDRLIELRDYHCKFSQEEDSKRMFHPFMSDIIANTICADLLDYLPRDRINLGMEYSRHDRIQRFLTIRLGTLYDNEGLRLSILVTRTQKGGQRRDVATAVLKIMRERYEMAERVYYHHKKAAVSSMLATLVEICHKPNEEENVYPAPWTSETYAHHILHFTDASFIDYLETAPLNAEKGKLVKRNLDIEKAKLLQRKLYLGIKYKRKEVYRTLLVLDTDLVHASDYTLGYFASDFRSKKRYKIEEELANAANGQIGDVLIYCPSSNMQSKEVDARLEIVPGQILPLSTQQKLFAYNEDVRVLQQYYKDLWRSYIFVSKDIFDNKKRCKAIVDTFCEGYKIKKVTAYGKVRTYEFSDEDAAITITEPIHQFLYNPQNGGLPFEDAPTPIITSFYKEAIRSYDEIKSDDKLKSKQKLTALFVAATLDHNYEKESDVSKRNLLNNYTQDISAGRKTFPLQRKGGRPYDNFKAFEKALLDAALGLIEESEKES